jgi:hypothetical protein
MAVILRGSRDDVRQLLAELVAALSGRGFDPHGIARPVLTRGAVALLSKIQQSFITKARGGTGEDGIAWKPLDRRTVAYGRRTTKAELRALGAGGRRVRGLLTPAQDRRWRAIYARVLAQMRARGLDDRQAAGTAARVAWARLKAEGALTKLQVLGGRQVDVLRDTGELLNSLTPGFEEAAVRAPGQVLEAEAGRIAVGTKVKPWHHRGVPGRLPARPFWPPDGNLPDAWWDAVRAAIVRGLVAAVARAALTNRPG